MNPSAPPTVIVPEKQSVHLKTLILSAVVVTLISGMLAGLYVVQRGQNITNTSATGACSGIDNPSVTGSITIPAGCSVSGVRFFGQAPAGVTNDGGCVGYSQNPSTVSYTGPTTINLSPPCGFCEQVDLNGGYGIAKYGGTCLKNCGDSCQNDSDCRNPSAAGIPTRCNPTTKICENAQCPAGMTQPGANCTCNAGRSCGQSCGASVGLCGDGISECGFITGANGCVAAEGNTALQFCLPKQQYLSTLQNGYTVARCNGIAANYLISPSGVSGSPPLTSASAVEACHPGATIPPSPTPTASPTVPSVSAQCLNIKVFDSQWQQLTGTQLQQLTPGKVLRFSVSGNTTSGTLQKAQFTVNGSTLPETTQYRPGTTEFYSEYTVPPTATNLEVKVKLYHPQIGWF